MHKQCAEICAFLIIHICVCVSRWQWCILCKEVNNSTTTVRFHHHIQSNTEKGLWTSNSIYECGNIDANIKTKPYRIHIYVSRAMENRNTQRLLWKNDAVTAVVVLATLHVGTHSSAVRRAVYVCSIGLWLFITFCNGVPLSLSVWYSIHNYNVCNISHPINKNCHIRYVCTM